jgi:hypothetical protein
VGGNALVGDCQASPKATDQPGSPVAASLALSTASVESDFSRVRHKLRKFLQRRPTMQSLQEKGYIKGIRGLPETGHRWRGTRWR